ncbi:hypothetical protein ACW5R3_04135 [Bizionia sp. KMM 8389]
MNKEIIKYNSLAKQINSKRYNKWYKLKDLVEIKAISYKSLKNMVKDIYDKYHELGIIKKESGRYFIHYTLLDKFKLKRPRQTTIYSHEWKSNISWTTKEFYSKEYHEFLVSELKKRTDGINYIYSIEKDKKDRYHVHMLADSDAKTLRKIIYELLKFYIENGKEFRLYCQSINNIGSSVDYLIKNPQ